MKASPGLLIFPSYTFFHLKHNYYSKVRDYDVFLVYEPVVVKSACRTERVLISLSPGSLIVDSDDDKLIELGACISLEYFWFKGSKIGWSLGAVPKFLEKDAKEAGFEISKGVEIIERSITEGTSEVKMPWHPASFALEDNIECKGFEWENGIELAKCGKSSLISMTSKEVYIGWLRESWRYLPLLAYASSR